MKSVLIVWNRRIFVYFYLNSFDRHFAELLFRIPADKDLSAKKLNRTLLLISYVIYVLDCKIFSMELLFMKLVINYCSLQGSQIKTFLVISFFSFNNVMTTVINNFNKITAQFFYGLIIRKFIEYLAYLLLSTWVNDYSVILLFCLKDIKINDAQRIRLSDLDGKILYESCIFTF